MVITYHNDTCFRVGSGKLNVVVDPVSDKFKSDITFFTRAKLVDVTKSSDSGRSSRVQSGGELSPPTSNKGETLIAGAGEYEIQEVLVRGLQTNLDLKTGIADIIYLITIENITILFMGNISSSPSSDIMEKIGDIDILFIPVGKGFLDPKSADKLIKQIDSSITVAYPPKQLTAFMDELGKKCEKLDKLVIKKKDIIEMGDKAKLICIDA